MAVAAASVDPGAAGARLRAGIAVVGGLVCAVAVTFVALRAPPGQAVGRGLLELLAVGVPVATGVYALGAPRDARIGAILAGIGFTWSLTALAESASSLPYSVGRVAGWLVFPWLTYLLLAFPEGRIDRGVDRALFRATNLVVALLFVGSAPFVEQYPPFTPWAACTAHCPANAFLVLDSQPAVMDDVVQPLREALAVVLFVAAVVSLARRGRGGTPLRRTTGPVLPVAAVSVGLLAGFYAARRFGGDEDAAETLGVLWAMSVAGIAAAFWVALMRRRLLVGEVLARLSGTLSHSAGTGGVRDALARELGDPTLELLVPDGPVRWRDSHGRGTDRLPAGTPGRRVTVIRDGREPAVALVHDPELRADDDVIGPVGALIVASLRQERLKRRLAVALEQLAGSRARIARAADLERARIERDLHDGAQQRLIALRMRLSLAEELLRSDPEAGAAGVAGIGEEVDRTLDDLRSLAQGVYPPVLRDRGIAAALHGLATEAPFPVHIQSAGLTRHSMDIETAVYFTCAEALQNAIKHASRAGGVRIVLRQGDALTAEVRDDGPGFMPPLGGAAGAGGLRNMRDRIEAVGGRLTVDAAPGRGTRIVAFIPLR